MIARARDPNKPDNLFRHLILLSVKLFFFKKRFIGNLYIGGALLVITDGGGEKAGLSTAKRYKRSDFAGC